MIQIKRSRNVSAIAALSTLLLGACTPSLTQRDLSAGVIVPEAWTAIAERTDDFGLDGWAASFEDTELVDLIAMGRERNPDLRTAAARLNQSKASARVAFADRLPTLDAQFTPTRLQSRFTAPNGQVGVVRQNNFSLAGNLAWEIDVWGRVASNVAAADADLMASKADLAAAQLSFGANVARAYFEIVAASELSRLAADSTNSFARSLNIVKARYRKGITNALDVRLAANSLESAKALQVQRASQKAESQRRLEVLLGQYPAGLISAAQTLPTLGTAGPTGIPSDLLSRRPDIRAAYVRLAAADYRVAEAKRNLLPSFQITGSAGNQTEIFSDFLEFDSLVWRISANVTQPIFQGGRLKETVKLRQAQADEAVASYAGTLLTAFQEVENALANEDFLREREAFLKQAVDEAAAATVLAQQQYSRGLTQILNLLDSQRRELDSRSQLID
ncbi:MAG: efflux transporter outer membrane subunit, partial [Pseudomonadota bacterium]